MKMKSIIMVVSVWVLAGVIQIFLYHHLTLFHLRIQPVFKNQLETNDVEERIAMEEAEYKMEEGRVMGTEFTSKENNHDRQQQGTRKYNSISVKEEGRGVALELHRLLTQPTTTCHKMIRMGGRSCLGAYDGTKMVCLDNDMQMKARQCLVYSFGVGHDFTFDEQVQDLGCEVHSFDHDFDHEIYDYRIGPTAFFHKVRIGPKTGSYSYCDDAAIGTGCDPPIRYQTFTDIRKSLGHERRRVDYLKFDIEGGEWEVLQQLLHCRSTRALLAAASHISIEVHLDAVLHMKTPEEKQNLLTTYLNTVNNLTLLGYHLLSYETNELNPQYEEVDGVQLSLFSEVLLINRNMQNFVLE